MANPVSVSSTSTQFPGDGEAALTATDVSTANASKVVTFTNSDATKNTFLVGIFIGYVGGSGNPATPITVTDGTNTLLNLDGKTPFNPHRPIFWGKGKNIVVNMPAGGASVISTVSIIAYTL